MPDKEILEVDGREIEISRPDKVLFPDAGITKLDLAEYHRDVADVMIPHVRGRVVTLQRFPDGIDDEGFYQKQAPGHFPDWIERVSVDTSDGPQEQVVVTSPADLVFLADQGTVTLHRWLSRARDIGRPDMVVFDLDPPSGDSRVVRRAASLTKRLLDGFGVPSGVMATGSKGFHVVIPILPDAGFDQVRETARSLARELAGEHPDALTTEVRRSARDGRVFLDYLRNSYAQTVVAPYAVRARDSAAVAHPIDWEELSGWDPAAHTIGSILRRLGQKPDPWAGLTDDAVEITALQP